jgi:hypothetical protein
MSAGGRGAESGAPEIVGLDEGVAEVLSPAGGAGVGPGLEGGDELVVRDWHRGTVAAGVPAPQHQLVLGDVLDQRGHVAIAIEFAVLDHRAQLVGRQADPGHLVIRRRQLPVRCARRRVRAERARREKCRDRFCYRCDSRSRTGKIRSRKRAFQ